MPDIHLVTDDLPTEEEIIQCQNLDRYCSNTTTS